MFELLVVLRGYSNVAELSWNRIGRSGVQAETENEKIAVMYSRSPQKVKFSHFTLLFCQWWRRNILKYITYLQGIVLLIKSYCFLTFPFPLPSPSPSPSYLLKLLSVFFRAPCTVARNLNHCLLIAFSGGACLRQKGTTGTKETFRGRSRK